MKWRELYNTLTLRDEDDQPDDGGNNFFERMALGSSFAFYPVHFVKNKTGDIVKILIGPEDVMIRILAVRVTNIFDELIMTCKFVGLLPPGFRHGTYSLRLEQFKDVHKLPRRLFDDEEIPTDELSQWKVDTCDSHLS
jgi:hypothetical protein